MNLKKMKLKSYSKIFILIILLGTTTLLYLFLAGWRPNLDLSGGKIQPSINLKQTGMISAKSILKRQVSIWMEN